MHLKLRDQQLYRLLYLNLMVTTKQKSIIETHTQKRKESKCNTKDSHQITREQNERRRKEQKRTTKTSQKQLMKWQ